MRTLLRTRSRVPHSVMLRGICSMLVLTAIIALSGTASAEQPAWVVTKVPEVWKSPPAEIQNQGAGFAWFRCRFIAPEDWKGRDFALLAEAADDARAYYLNGKLVASSGGFPPKYQSGLGAPDHNPLPAGAIRPGAENVLAIRVFQQESRTNFNVAAPVVVAGGEAIHLLGNWELHYGDLPPEQAVLNVKADAYQYVMPLAEAEDSWKRLESDEGPIAADEAVKRFEVPEDLAIELALSEPEIGQPLSIKFDARGRLWVMQYLQYPNPAGLKMVSRDKFLRTVWDKVPPAPPHHFVGEDKITIHEDTDQDGRYDRHQTFVDGLNIASSFAIASDGLWVLNPPYLLFYPDRNQDDQPDGDPEVHLAGFGLEDSHSIANSLRWGPDGWLYAAQGSTVTGQITHGGADEAPIHSMGQLIWRYHPATHKYEVFAEGGGNTFGVEIDSKGRIFSGHNGGDTRGFHYVQGGYYQKGFGKHGELSNPFAYGYFAQMAHHAVPRFTHTFTIYEADALPAAYHGHLFGVHPLMSHVVISSMAPDGSTFKTKDTGYAAQTKDSWFRPVDIQLGPDGALYVCDFYEQRIDHASHYQGRIHKTSGRIYRLRAKEGPRRAATNVAAMNSAELVAALRDPNRWVRETASRLLAERKAADSVPLLRSMLEDETGQPALEAFWALSRITGLADGLAAETLAHADPYVRLWTVREVCDDGELSSPLVEQLRELAHREPHVEVRSQLACSARRLPAAAALPILAELLRREEDTADAHVPLLLWWGIEAKIATNRTDVLALLADESLWQSSLVREHLLERLMRRLASAGSQADLVACAELLKLAPSEETAQRLMKGFEKAYEGRLLVGLPAVLVDEIAKIGGGSFVLRMRQGDAEALAEAIQQVLDENTDPAKRTLYIQVLSQIRHPPAAAALLQLVSNSPNDLVRIAALNALQAFTDPAIAPTILALHDKLSPDVRAAAQSVLASRPEWTLALLTAVGEGAVNRELLPLPLVRRLLLHKNEQVAANVKAIWGDVQGASTEEMRKAIGRLTAIVGDGVGNPYSGKVLFAEQCGKCHMLFNQGGKIGPDLTAYRRDDVRGMLANIVNPSLEIREGFENYVVLTADGRALNGFVLDQDNQTVVLRDAEGQSTVVPRDEIEDMHAIPRSIMPEGLLQTYSEQQVRDLFAYLRSTQPLP